MKKIFLSLAIIPILTACGSKNSASSDNDNSSQKEESNVEEYVDLQNSDDNYEIYSETDEIFSETDENAPDGQWSLSKYDDGFKEVADRTTYDGKIQSSLAKIATVIDDEVVIEEKGSGQNTYYIISPTISVTEPVENVDNVVVTIELLDELESPIPYTYSLAGKEYKNTYYALSNPTALEKAIKNGGECKLSFKIVPSDYEDFSTDLFDTAKYFRITGEITSSPQE